MFITRLISGIILVELAFLTICCGGWVLYFTMLTLSLIGAWELYKSMNAHEEKPFGLLEIAEYISILMYYVSLILMFGVFQMMAVILGLIILMFLYVFLYPHYHANQVMAAFFGIVYLGVMLSYIYQTRMLPGGIFHVWLIFFCSWGYDTCAYCVGMLIGKHKIDPILSPKKTVEGAVGGVIGSMILGLLYALIIRKAFLQYTVICGIGALFSMVGDLAASGIKRNMKIKDYGKLIVGHGGILDRFDSVIFTAPVIYYLFLFLQ